MSRKLIMILNDGGRGNYLPGVETDARNYLDFFHLPEGGSWGDDEIHIYRNNCTFVMLNSYILQQRHEGLQYVVIVFCGHGYADDHDMTFFELSPGHEASLRQMKDIVRETRCLMIADSCRVTVLAEGGRIPDERMFSEDIFGNDYRRECFRLYDESFRGLNRGHFTIGMAASIGQSAGENENGGYYSKALLTKARNLITAKKATRQYVQNYEPIAKFPLVHALVRDSFTNNAHIAQIPDIQAPQGQQAPFVVVAR